ncbi:MAG: MFS transporter, partial [Bdellovibrionales bacterium]|nr:MFS transporter [Bdellovibrionales bacterium]
AFAGSFPMLILCRIFAGLFTANISTAMASIADVTPTEKRAQSMGLIGAAFGIGFIVGPAFGGLLSQWGAQIGSTPPWGMSFPSLGAAVLCFLNFLSAIFFLPESLPPEKRTRAIVMGAEDASPTPSLGMRIKKVFEAFGKPVVGPLMWIYFLVGLGMAHMEVSLGLFLKESYGWSLTKSSYMFALVGLVMAFTQGYLIRKLLPKLGERTILAVGLALGGVGLSGLAFIQDPSPLYVLMFLLSIGVSLANPATLGSISALSSSEAQGKTFGETQSLAALGRILGPISGGFLYSQFGKQSPFLMGGALFGLGLMILASIFSRIPRFSKKT